MMHGVLWLIAGIVIMLALVVSIRLWYSRNGYINGLSYMKHWDFERYYRIERIVALFIIALAVSMFLLVVAVVVFPMLGCL